MGYNAAPEAFLVNNQSGVDNSGNHPLNQPMVLHAEQDHHGGKRKPAECTKGNLIKIRINYIT